MTQAFLATHCGDNDDNHLPCPIRCGCNLAPHVQVDAADADADADAGAGAGADAHAAAAARNPNTMA
jgi:hypothetical protein